MKIGAIPVGQLGTNCYIAWDEDTRKCVVIDPGDDADRILSYIKGEDLKVQCIFLTHGHFDHVLAMPRVRDETGAKVYVHSKERVRDDFGGARVDLSDCEHYGEGDEITVGSMTFRVLETPGHTPGSVALLCGEYIFSGDTLFEGSCGRTDFPGGSWKQMLHSLKRLYDLEGDYVVLSGHGEKTSLDRERRSNMFMREALSD